MTPTNPKPPSLRERILSILNEHDKYAMCLDENDATDRILLAVKEAMPEKHDHSKCPYCVWPESCVDWNDYREEMEKRCE